MDNIDTSDEAVNRLILISSVASPSCANYPSCICPTVADMLRALLNERNAFASRGIVVEEAKRLRLGVLLSPVTK